MNTTKKGDSFETRSIEIIKKVMSDGQLGHMTSYINIIPKAKYFSPMRRSDITFDIAIEVKPPEAKRCVIIYIIECKNYSKRVPVEKVERFLFSIKDVGLANVKGIFITNSPLQKSAYNLADTAGLMLIQGESVSDYKILLHKTNRELKDKRLPFIPDTFDETLLDIGANLIEKLIDEQFVSVLQTELSEERISYGIDKLSKSKIEEISDLQLSKIDRKILTHGHQFSIGDFEDYMFKSYGITIEDLEPGQELLGFCDIENKKIGLHPKVRKTNREFFILSHEFAHFILHQKLSIGQNSYEFFKDSEYSFKTGKHHLSNPRHWIEWQANYFASCFTMPKGHFVASFFMLQDEMNVSKGKILLTDNPNTLRIFYNIIRKLAFKFYVSQTSVIYKLKELDLINNKTREKSIGQLIEEFNEEMIT